MTTPTVSALPEAATRTRKMYTAKEKAELLALFEQHEMTPAEFCREMSIHEATFSLWRRAAREEAAPISFAEVQVSAAPSSETALILHLPNGARVEAPASDATWRGFAALLNALST